jgi:NMT1/THI5 like
MPPVSVALDWTPNVNHAGFFVALQRGYYADRGLDIMFESPHADGYATTPARKLAGGSVNIAICPSESIISYACQVWSRVRSGTGLIALLAVVTLYRTLLSRRSVLDPHLRRACGINSAAPVAIASAAYHHYVRWA